MNKPIVKTAAKNQVQRPQQPLQNQRSAPPAVREVNLPAHMHAVNKPGANNNVLVAYKDMNPPAPKHNPRNLLIAIGVFTLLAVGILVGHQMNKSRTVASGDLARMIPAGAQNTVTESYKYEKSCYTGENGEEVCMTRTSQAR